MVWRIGVDRRGLVAERASGAETQRDVILVAVFQLHDEHRHSPHANEFRMTTSAVTGRLTATAECL